MFFKKNMSKCNIFQQNHLTLSTIFVFPFSTNMNENKTRQRFFRLSCYVTPKPANQKEAMIQTLFPYVFLKSFSHFTCFHLEDETHKSDRIHL